MCTPSQLQQLAEQQWDIIVIGGGITGAGIAREAARNKLKVLLLEQQDFAWGTSSRSSKMVHGGLRYLAQGDISLTRHSLQERELLLQQAPGLIERLGYFYLIKKSQWPMKFGLKIILSVYDFLAGIKDHYLLNKYKLKQSVPQLDIEPLAGAAYFTDAVTDDARLVYRVLREAQRDGAKLCNYCKVISTRSDQHSTTNQVVVNRVNDEGKNFTLNAKVVINSTGAWADQLRIQRKQEHRIRPLKGSHILLRKGLLPLKQVISFQHPDDGRNMFAYPWLGHTVLGTTDIDNDGDINTEAAINAAEAKYLLFAANHHFGGTKVCFDDVISTWSGVRPVIASDVNFQQQNQQTRKKPSKERRDHAIWDDEGLITVTGGKLTTFRLMAIDVLNKAAPYIGHFNFGQYPVFTEQATPTTTDKTRFGWYGIDYPQYLQQTKGQCSTPLQETPYSLSDIQWSLQNEWVQHLDDLLLRRTRLGLLVKEGAAGLLPRIKPLVCTHLGWDEARWESEQQRYLTIWRNHYSLPQGVE